MDYKNYIDLGFKRTDFDDSVEFDETGYGGFSLSKKVTDRMTIEVCSGELDRPKLFIRKGDSDTNHIFTITPEAVVDIFREK